MIIVTCTPFIASVPVSVKHFTFPPPDVYQSTETFDKWLNVSSADALILGHERRSNNVYCSSAAGPNSDLAGGATVRLGVTATPAESPNPSNLKARQTQAQRRRGIEAGRGSSFRGGVCARSKDDDDGGGSHEEERNGRHDALIGSDERGAEAPGMRLQERRDEVREVDVGPGP
eukprot:1627634-Rhodomonas_salina.1